jgi:Tol biopolymer transport system component
LSRNSIAIALLAALACLTLVPAADAAYPGRPGLIVFSLTFHEGNEGGAGGTETGGLYALRPGAGTARRLTNDPRDTEPSFAPSGKKIAFVRSYGLAPGRPYPLTSISTLDMRTGTVKQLTSGYFDLDPTFGPHGMIVFSRYEPLSQTSYLLLRTANGRLHRLATGPYNDGYPVFTPNGKRIVFVRTSESEWRRTALTSMRLDGRGVRTLGHQRVASYLDISPDGRLLAFNAVRELPHGQLSSGSWTWPVSGGPLRPLAYSGSHPAFSPGGGKIVYSNDAGLWLRPAHKHGPAHQIFKAEFEFESGNGALAKDPTWQPLR